jgi:WD40 repeat protein
MYSQKFLHLSCALILAGALFAVDTRYWSQDTQADFEKGSRKSIALRKDGRLSLAPALQETGDPSIPYLWAAAIAPNGTAYFAGGPASGKAKIFSLARGGSLQTVAEVEGMNIFALAVSANGTVFAGTSPDGKVYLIRPNAEPEIFYDPKSKYIWALQFASNGDLLVATGDKGELHRVAPNGTGRVWMKIEEDHIRSLAITSKQEIYAGTEPGGLILRVDSNGQGFVVHQSAKREVTTLLAAPDGSLYAAAIGNKTPTSQIFFPQPVPVAPGAPAAGQPATPAPANNSPNTGQRPGVAPIPAPAPNPVPGGSEITRIAPDGAPTVYWSNAQDLVYSLGLDGQNRLLIGTGNKGNLYRAESAIQYELLLELPASQVTALVRDNNRTLIAGGNVGKVYELSDQLAKEGIFESQVYDASHFAQWGRLHFKSATNGGTITFETRSGNLDRPTQLWSPWTPLSNGRVASPPARFLQWRAVLRAPNSTANPQLTQVDVAYLPKNLPPQIELVEPTPANYRFPQPPGVLTAASTTLTLPPMGKPNTNAAPAAPDVSSTPSLTYARGMIGVRWLAADPNGDNLEFTVEIKGENENSWKLLKDKVRERYHSYDATAFADGRYQIRVTATDQPGNPAGQGLTASLVSPYFLIDNTPPQIRELAAANNTLRFKASDALTVISKAEMSINGGNWTVIEPTSRLADSLEHEYNIPLTRAAGEELTIAVRVTDEFDNQAVAKTVLR